MAYYLFHHKGWAPGDYYNRPQGERDLILALASYEIEHRKDGPRCPLLRT